MKKFFGQYKEMLLSFGLTGILLGLTLTLSGGLGTQTASLVTARKYEHYTDSSTLKTEALRPRPEIKTREEMQWSAGGTVSLKDAFEARDYTGAGLEVKVLEITNIREENITSLFNAQTDSIIFPEPGCYYFLLQTTDSQNRIAIDKRPLVIDR